MKRLFTLLLSAVLLLSLTTAALAISGPNVQRSTQQLTLDGEAIDCRIGQDLVQVRLERAVELRRVFAASALVVVPDDGRCAEFARDVLAVVDGVDVRHGYDSDLHGGFPWSMKVELKVYAIHYTKCQMGPQLKTLPIWQKKYITIRQ